MSDYQIVERYFAWTILIGIVTYDVLKLGYLIYQMKCIMNKGESEDA